MKKLLTRPVALIMCALMCISLAACGGKSSGNLEDYFKDHQSELDALNEGLSNEQMAVTVSAEGNKLVYEFKYLIDIGDTDSAKEALETYAGQLESTFKTTLSGVKANFADTESVVVNFLDMNGETILSKEYK